MTKKPEPISGFHGHYRFLSNFWMMPVYFGTWRFASAEHAYQAAKSEDPADWARIQSCPKPGAAKRMGKDITLRPNWDTVKLDIMEEIIRVKFEHPRLRPMLIATGDAELIETNTWGDTYWGVCNGKGSNHLGKLLMAERAKIQAIT